MANSDNNASNNMPSVNVGTNTAASQPQVTQTQASAQKSASVVKQQTSNQSQQINSEQTKSIAKAIAEQPSKSNANEKKKPVEFKKNEQKERDSLLSILSSIKTTLEQFTKSFLSNNANNKGNETPAGGKKTGSGGFANDPEILKQSLNSVAFRSNFGLAIEKGIVGALSSQDVLKNFDDLINNSSKSENAGVQNSEQQVQPSSNTSTNDAIVDAISKLQNANSNAELKEAANSTMTAQQNLSNEHIENLNTHSSDKTANGINAALKEEYVENNNKNAETNKVKDELDKGASSAVETLTSDGETLGKSAIDSAASQTTMITGASAKTSIDLINGANENAIESFGAQGASLEESTEIGDKIDDIIDNIKDGKDGKEKTEKDREEKKNKQGILKSFTGALKGIILRPDSKNKSENDDIHKKQNGAQAGKELDNNAMVKKSGISGFGASMFSKIKDIKNNVFKKITPSGQKQTAKDQTPEKPVASFKPGEIGAGGIPKFDPKVIEKMVSDSFGGGFKGKVLGKLAKVGTKFSNSKVGNKLIGKLVPDSIKASLKSLGEKQGTNDVLNKGQKKMQMPMQENKNSMLKSIVNYLKSILDTIKGENAQKRAEAIKKAQFGDRTNKNSKSSSNLTSGYGDSFKKIISTLKKLPEQISSSMILAKIKMIMMVVGLLVALGVVIWQFLSNPELFNKVIGWISSSLQWIWSKFTQLWGVLSPKGKLILGSLMTLAGAMAIKPGIKMLKNMKFVIKMLSSGLKSSFSMLKTGVSWIIKNVVIGAVKKVMLLYGNLAAMHAFGPYAALVAIIAVIGVLIWSLISKFGAKIWNGIKSAAKAVGKALFYWATWPFQLIFKFFPSLGEKIKGALKAAIGWIPGISWLFGDDEDESENGNSSNASNEQSKNEEIEPDETSSGMSSFDVGNNEPNMDTSTSISHNGGKTEIDVTIKKDDTYDDKHNGLAELLNNMMIHNSMALTNTNQTIMLASAGIAASVILGSSFGLGGVVRTLTGIFGKKQAHPLENKVENCIEILKNIASKIIPHNSKTNIDIKPNNDRIKSLNIFGVNIHSRDAENVNEAETSSPFSKIISSSIKSNINAINYRESSSNLNNETYEMIQQARNNSINTSNNGTYENTEFDKMDYGKFGESMYIALSRYFNTASLSININKEGGNSMTINNSDRNQISVESETSQGF